MPRRHARELLYYSSPRSHVLLAAVSVLFLATNAIPAVPEQTPSAIHHPSVDYPIWVSAGLGQTKGALNPETFSHPVVKNRIARIFEQTPVRGCYEVGPIILDRVGGRPSPKSLEQAARDYPVVAMGVVEELTPGFLVGEPGTMVRAEVEDVSRDLATGSSFFVFIPIAEFEFLGKRICKRDPRYPGLPKIGDEVLLFADPTQAEGVQYLAPEHPESLIWISDREVRYAPSLAKREDGVLPKTRESLFRELRSLPSWERRR
jgi:hypothetical protein